MNRHKEPRNQIDEIKLFYNDVKYVTRSLTKDSEALYSCLAAHSVRHKHREPREIEAFMKDEEKRLEAIKQKFHQLGQMSKRGRQKFHIAEWNSFKELKQVVEDLEDITIDLKPSGMWFKKANYDTIHDMLDEVQTKSEDSVKSRKRIFKVWSEDVFQAHNVRFTIEYVDMLNGTMKYFNTNFWKYRKHLKTLFIEEESLFSDEEIKLLKKNVATMTENDNWLFFKQRRIQEVIGENYIGKETDFNEIRKKYDSFYSWLLKQPDDETITIDNFAGFCEFIRDMKSVDYQPYFVELHEYIPFFSEEMVYQMTFFQIEQQIADYQMALEIIKDQYGFTYLNDMKEAFTFDSWSKLIQRVIEKKNWLNEKKEQIEFYFGGIYTGVSTNWEEMKECVLESADMIHGILLRRIKQYGFFIPKEEKYPDKLETIEQAANWVLQEENSVPVTEFVKKCSKLLGFKRVTASFKKEAETYLEQSLRTDYKVDNELIIKKNVDNLVFQIASDGGKREVDWISDAEMKNGVLRVITVEEEIPLDDITKLFSRLLGYPRRTRNLQTKVEHAVLQLKKDGKIVRKSGGWCLFER